MKKNPLPASPKANSTQPHKPIEFGPQNKFSPGGPGKLQHQSHVPPRSPQKKP